MLYLICLQTNFSDKIYFSEELGLYIEKVTDSFEITKIIDHFNRYHNSYLGNFFDRKEVWRVHFQNEDELFRVTQKSSDLERFKSIMQRKNEIKNIMNVFLFSLPKTGIITFFPFFGMDSLIDIYDNDPEQISRLGLSSVSDLLFFNNTPDDYTSNVIDTFSKITRTIKEQQLFFDLFQKSNTYESYDIDIAYIGEYLELYKKSSDPKIRFGLLISVIEYLLCSGKEEITKQFRIKLSIATERIQKITAFEKICDKEIGLLYHEIYINRLVLPKLCDIVYDARSKIVHGKKKDIDLCLRKFGKILDSDGIREETLFNFLERITTSIVSLAIKEPEYIKFLRDLHS